MCCINNPKLTKELFHRMNKPKGKKVFYKVYWPFSKNEVYMLSSIFRCHRVFTYGLINSNFKGNPEDIRKITNAIIGKGIHIYLKENKAKKLKTNLEIVIKVIAKARDLIGCDGETAVFTKVEIPKKEWEKAKRRFENGRKQNS